MKTSHKKLLLFQLALSLIIFINSFVSSILSEYKVVLFLIIALVFFKILFGFEKDRHRYTKDIIFEVIIFLLMFLMIYYLFGVVISFAKTANYYNWSGFTKFIFPLVFTIILREFLRYMMLTKSEGSKLLVVTTTLLFIFFDISNALYYNGFGSAYDSFMFVALTLLPAISTNIVYSYISIRTGYKPLFLYALVVGLYPYLLPIVPNPDEYIASVVNLIVISL